VNGTAFYLNIGGLIMGIPTQIDVRVLAKGGKFLGDDIGGALVTVHDVRTGELLAHGNTSGGSGEENLMGICLTRSEVLPVNEASLFSATLDLDEPRLIKVTAYGPLAAQQSANSAVITQWVYPGKDITGVKKGGGFFLELPGLIVQILNPPTHFLPKIAPEYIDIKTNVTMMCGCPIGPDHSPWFPDQFEVKAVIMKNKKSFEEITLDYDKNAPDGIPSRFANKWKVPKNDSAEPQIYEIIVFAFQQEQGNTGVDKATIIIPPASAVTP
jgi:hypothetical protein